MLRRCYANARNRRRDYSLNGKKLPVWKYEQQMSFILPFSLASQKYVFRANIKGVLITILFLQIWLK